MEEILKRIIEIDNKAKDIVSEEQEKKKQIDETLQSEVNTGKAILDVEYKDEINKIKANYDRQFEEKKQEIDVKINNQKVELDNYIRYNEDKIVKEIIDKIKDE